MQFKLTVKLGNDAMQTGSDIAELLRALADRTECEALMERGSGSVRDINGNTVGTWKVTK